MDVEKIIQEELNKGFSKTDLEKLIGLPQNFLSGFLKGKKRISKKGVLKVEKYLASEKQDPLNLNFTNPPKKIKENKTVVSDCIEKNDEPKKIKGLTFTEKRFMAKLGLK